MLTGDLVKNSNGYIIENSNYSNILPKRIKKSSDVPPPGMMTVPQSLPPGGFIGNRKQTSPVFVPKGRNTNTGNMFTSGPAPKSNQVPTVSGSIFRKG